MKKFDLNGLRLAEYQGKLFEDSINRFEVAYKLPPKEKKTILLDVDL